MPARSLRNGDGGVGSGERGPVSCEADYTRQSQLASDSSQVSASKLFQLPQTSEQIVK